MRLRGSKGCSWQLWRANSSKLRVLESGSPMTSEPTLPLTAVWPQGKPPTSLCPSFFIFTVTNDKACH